MIQTLTTKKLTGSKPWKWKNWKQTHRIPCSHRFHISTPWTTFVKNFKGSRSLLSLNDRYSIQFFLCLRKGSNTLDTEIRVFALLKLFPSRRNNIHITESSRSAHLYTIVIGPSDRQILQPMPFAGVPGSHRRTPRHHNSCHQLS